MISKLDINSSILPCDSFSLKYRNIEDWSTGKQFSKSLLDIYTYDFKKCNTLIFPIIFKYFELTEFLLNCDYYKFSSKVLKAEDSTRIELAKLIGLDSIPSPDRKAIEKMAGIIADTVEEEIDAVDLVREIRG